MNYCPSILQFTSYCNTNFMLKFSKFLRNTLYTRNFQYCSYFHSNNFDLSNEEYHASSDINTPILSSLISIPESDEKLCVIVNEIQNIVIKGRRYPEYLNANQLHTLYSLETKTQRLKYLIYLFKKEKVKLSEEQKKVEKRAKSGNRKLEKNFHFECNSSPIYGVGRNTLLLKVHKKSIHKFYNCRLANSALFGSKIVIDLDYEKYMIEKEKSSCANQLRHIYSTNRKDSKPFDLYFCNANPNNKSIQYFKRDVPNVTDSLTTLYEGSYLDLFPKEHLVYLSPHAEESLKIYDHSAIYIIGGFVDIVKKRKVSGDKASVEGIKSYSLPLDEYIQWKQGTKSLAINQVFEIMLALKNTGSWKKAFEYIPSRKIQNLATETESLLNNVLL